MEAATDEMHRGDANILVLFLALPVFLCSFFQVSHRIWNQGRVILSRGPYAPENNPPACERRERSRRDCASAEVSLPHKEHECDESFRREQCAVLAHVAGEANFTAHKQKTEARKFAGQKFAEHPKQEFWVGIEERTDRHLHSSQSKIRASEQKVDRRPGPNPVRIVEHGTNGTKSASGRLDMECRGLHCQVRQQRELSPSKTALVPDATTSTTNNCVSAVPPVRYYTASQSSSSCKSSFTRESSDFVGQSPSTSDSELGSGMSEASTKNFGSLLTQSSELTFSANASSYYSMPYVDRAWENTPEPNCLVQQNPKRTTEDSLSAQTTASPPGSSLKDPESMWLFAARPERMVQQVLPEVCPSTPTIPVSSKHHSSHQAQLDKDLIGFGAMAGVVPSYFSPDHKSREQKARECMLRGSMFDIDVCAGFSDESDDDDGGSLCANSFSHNLNDSICIRHRRLAFSPS